MSERECRRQIEIANKEFNLAQVILQYFLFLSFVITTDPLFKTFLHVRIDL